MYKWLSDNLDYPMKAIDSNIEGTVYVSLVIEKDGSVSNVKALKGVERGSSLNDEAVLVVSAMPKWEPGVEQGHIVRVQITLPINFKLSETHDTLWSYNHVQVKPEFPGKIGKWLEDNTDYPKIAIEEKTQDTILVSFIVEKDGSVSHVKVAKGENKYLKREAVWVVSNMPRWKPGKQNGQPAKVVCSVPFYFMLSAHRTSKSKIKVDTNFQQFGKKPMDTVYTTEHFRIIRENAKFPGKMNDWLEKHLNYPKMAENRNTQGTVYLSFIVEKDGSVGNVKVLRGVNKYLDNEAVWVISDMPRWIPAKENGNPVRSLYTIPIHFIIPTTDSY